MVREKWGRQRSWWPRKGGVVLQTTHLDEVLVRWPDGKVYWHWKRALKGL